MLIGVGELPMNDPWPPTPVVPMTLMPLKAIWDVSVQLLFYASPVMYVASRYKGIEHVALLSPFAMLLTQMGHAFIDPTPAPAFCHHIAASLAQKMPECAELRSAAAAAGGSVRLLIPIAIILGTFALGWWVFTREAPRVAENL